MEAVLKLHVGKVTAHDRNKFRRTCGENWSTCNNYTTVVVRHAAFFLPQVNPKTHAHSQKNWQCVRHAFAFILWHFLIRLCKNLALHRYFRRYLLGIISKWARHKLRNWDKILALVTEHQNYKMFKYYVVSTNICIQF